MRKITTALLLGTMLVSGTTLGGPAQAQSVSGDQYPFCRALDLPPPSPEPPPSAPAAAQGSGQAAALPEPAQAAASPESAQAAAALESARAAAAATTGGTQAPAEAAPVTPATAPSPPPPPNIADLLKSSTDYNKIVDTLLDANQPSAIDYGTVFQSLVVKIVADDYVDASKAATISSLQRQYLGKIASREDLDKAIYDLVQKLGDSSTSYLSAPEKLSNDLRGSIQKIAFFGAHLRARPDGAWEISSIEPGSTADLAAFRVGDIIVSINGKSLQGLNKADAEDLELKPVGNQLQVVSLQDGSKVDAPYMLQQNVPYKPAIQLLPQQVAYIKMPTVINYQLVGAVIQNLIKMQIQTPGGMAGIVLDLRYVDEASLQNTRALLPYLISKTVVLHEQKRQGPLTVDSTDLLSPLPDDAKASLTADQLQILQDLSTMPMVTLINGSTTAAGAEQLALALREGRSNTTIVGEHTRGNGVESTVVLLPNCGQLTLATTRYTTAKGVFIGDVGITPDFLTLPSRLRQDGDVQMAKAVDLVHSQSAYRPVNLVASDAVNIPALGPAPNRAAPAEDVDIQRSAYEHQMWIIQGLIGLALLICALLYLLMSPRGSSEWPRSQNRRKGE